MWSDIDLVGSSMTIHRNVSRTVLQDTPKGEVGTIKLTPRLAEALLQQRAVRKARFFLVPKLRKAEHASDYVLGHVVKFLQQKAGLPVYGAHRIRHSVLSLLARAGVTPYALLALARHAHLSTTMSFYIHLKKAELAAEAISALSLPVPMDPGNGQAIVANAAPQHLPRLDAV
jgi:integrase